MRIEVSRESTYAYTGAREVDPGQPSVVFVHGAGLDHSVWVLQSRYFAHHGRNSLALDLPGHGRSAGQPCRSIEVYADWVIEFLDALSIEQAALVGHSMGSLVALEGAARHPDRVSALGLVGVSVPMPVSDALLAAAGANDHAAIDMINVWGHSLGQLGGHRGPGQWMMGGAVRLLERSRPGVLHNDLRACNDYQHGLAAGENVRCPSVLVIGERDMMSPPKRSFALAGEIRDARTVIVPECGHMLMAERPDEVLDALIELLAD